ITIEAVPVLAAAVVRCQVIPPSGFSTDHLAGGNVGSSKPCTTERVTFPVTKNALLSVSFNGDSSPVPEEETGSALNIVIVCCPSVGVKVVKGTVIVSFAKSEIPVTVVSATAPLSLSLIHI